MLVGRGDDVEQIEGCLLRGERLVTLTGPAGVGKTALARHLADRMRARAELDVHEVDLTQARDAVGACAEVARALDISLSDVSSDKATAERLGRSLATLGPVLLVLDGVDAILPLARDPLRAWLAHAPHAQFLLTARQRTRLPEEQARELAPLALPSDRAPAWDSPAVQLWVERTRAVCPGYEPDDAELPAISQLVRELDGLPLAIELAAARGNTLSPADQLKRLDDRFALLSAPDTGALRPLDVALSDCWAQLADWEQAALVQCTAFVASFSMADAARVVDVSGFAGAPAAESAVQSLRDKSLALTELLGRERRLRLYRSVRDFARGHAAAAHGLRQACARHAALCLERAGRLGNGQLENQPLAALGKDLEAVVERFAVSDPAQAARAALALERWAWSHGPLQRHEERLTRLLEPKDGASALPAHESALAYEARARVRRQLGDPASALSDLACATQAAQALSSDALRARLLLGRALCVSVQEGFLEQAVEEAEAALALARAAGSADLELEILRFLMVTERRKGAAAEAVARAEQALAAAQQHGDRLREAHFLHCLAESHVQLGDMALASEYAKSALTLAERLGTQRLTAQLLVTDANIEHLSRRFEPALERYRQAIAAAQAVGDRELVALATTFAAFARYEAGRGPAARVQLRDGLALLERVGNRRYAAFARATLAYAEARAGNFEAAERILSEAETALREQQDAMLLCAVDLCRGLVEVTQSWQKTTAERATALRSSARGRLERARASTPVPATSRSSEVRYMARVLTDLLAATTSAGDRNDVLSVKVARNLHWFELDGGRRVDLRRRRPMQLVLGELVRAPKGEELSPDALINAGWPGERMLHEAAQNRLHVTLSRLRDLGLRDVLVSTASGYALSPKLEIEWVD